MIKYSELSDDDLKAKYDEYSLELQKIIDEINKRSKKDMTKKMEKLSTDDLSAYFSKDTRYKKDEIIMYIEELYHSINLPKGVINTMLVFVAHKKNGELPHINYFKKIAESWIKEKINTTSKAVIYTNEHWSL